MVELQIPLGMTIQENGDRRLYHEQQVLKRYFPGFDFVQDRTNGRFAARGILSTAVDYYGIRVELPERYPYKLPHIAPINWKASGPHVYPSGNLCVMKPDQWRNSYSVALLVAKSAIWVNKFELYKSSGSNSWPGNEQLHGLRLLRKWLEDLVE